jgi:hypothetical protein
MLNDHCHRVSTQLQFIIIIIIIIIKTLCASRQSVTLLQSCYNVVFWNSMTCLFNDASYSKVGRLDDIKERVWEDMQGNTRVLI